MNLPPGLYKTESFQARKIGCQNTLRDGPNFQLANNSFDLLVLMLLTLLITRSHRPKSCEAEEYSV